MKKWVVFVMSFVFCWIWISSISIGMGQESIKDQGRVDLYPMSDPMNSKNWILDEKLSDEFEGNTLDVEKWQPIPYTWSGAWRWEDKNVSLEEGVLHLRAIFDQDTLLDETPNGWQSHNMYDGDSVNGEYVTSLYGARSGKNALVYGNFFPIWVRTDTVIKGLDPSKTYVFSAYVKKTGHQPITQMFAVDPDDKKTIRIGVERIEESQDFVKYTLSNIKPTEAGTCKIGFEIKADPYAMTMVDDITFVEEGTNINLAPNPGFEDVTAMNYSSGGIISRQSMKYGYMETKAKGANVLPGTCSAIWLLGRTEQWGTEIDVLEIGQSGVVNQMEYALHTFKTPQSVLNPIQNFNPHGSIGIYDPNTGEDGFNPSEEYHVYGLEWGPGYQNFYIDGVLNGRYYSRKAGQEAIEGDPGYSGWQKETDHAMNMNSIPQNLLLSLGLRHPYWNQGNTTPLDTTFDVEYVRVWRNDNPEITGNITGINMKYGNIVVPYGTTEEEIIKKLDTSVTVVLDKRIKLEEQRQIDVTWDTSKFDGRKEGTIIKLKGVFDELPEGVVNTDNIEAQVHVYIQPKPFEINKETLMALVNRVYEKKEYIDMSWKNYLEKKNAAQEVLDMAYPSQVEIEYVYHKLQESIDGLERIPNLMELLILEFYGGNYVVDSWVIYSEAFEHAKKINGNLQATSKEIESAYNQLKEAIDGLERLPMGSNVIYGKSPISNVNISYPQAATDGNVDTRIGWGPSTDKSMYTTVNAGEEMGGNDNGYSTWDGAYLEYNFGEKKKVKQVEVYRFWYRTSLDGMTFKDVMIQLSEDSEFSPSTTVTIFGGDLGLELVMGSDIAPDGGNRRKPQIITLNVPVEAQYMRVFGRGHFNPWNVNSSRMSYSEIKVLEVVDTGSYGVTGQVIDQNMAPILDAEVHVFSGEESNDSKKIQTVTTNIEGKYQFWGLKDGMYYIEVVGNDNYLKLGKSFKIHGGNIQLEDLQVENVIVILEKEKGNVVYGKRPTPIER